MSRHFFLEGEKHSSPFAPVSGTGQALSLAKGRLAQSGMYMRLALQLN